MYALFFLFLTTTEVVQDAAPTQSVVHQPAAISTETKTSLEEKSHVFNPGVLLQGWIFGNYVESKTTSTFRLRRAELHVRGEIVPNTIDYAFMIDPAKALEFQDSRVGTNVVKQPVGPVSILQDIFLTYRTRWLDISLGQFKIPVSYEGYNSSAKLLFAERAPVSREFGDKRDLGLRLSKIYSYFGFSAGIFNGVGQNNLDTNNAKDVALRIEGYPLTGLAIGAVGYATAGKRRINAKDRVELDLRWENYGFLLQSEVIIANDLVNKTRTRSGGFYVAAAYTFKDTWQPIARIGHLDPNLKSNLDPTTAKGRDELWHYDLGINYYVKKNQAKIQGVFQRWSYNDKKAENQFILATQLSY